MLFELGLVGIYSWIKVKNTLYIYNQRKKEAFNMDFAKNTSIGALKYIFVNHNESII